MTFVRVLYITLRFWPGEICSVIPKGSSPGHSQKILPAEDIDTIEKVYRAFEEIEGSVQDVWLSPRENTISFLR